MEDAAEQVGKDAGRDQLRQQVPVHGIVSKLKGELKQKQKDVIDLQKQLQQYSRDNEKLKVSHMVAFTASHASMVVYGTINCK